MVSPTMHTSESGERKSVIDLGNFVTRMDLFLLILVRMSGLFILSTQNDTQVQCSRSVLRIPTAFFIEIEQKF